MIKFKIIEGYKDDFVKSFQNHINDKWLIEFETYRNMDLCGKMYYSVMISREVKE